MNATWGSSPNLASHNIAFSGGFLFWEQGLSVENPMPSTQHLTGATEADGCCSTQSACIPMNTPWDNTVNNNKNDFTAGFAIMAGRFG